MKKIILVFLAVYSFAYVTATTGILGKDTFIYNNGFISWGKVNIDGLNNLSKKIEITKKTITKKNEFDFDEGTVYELDNISKKDILNYLVFNKPKNELFINNKYCRITANKEKLNNKVLGNIQTNRYNIKCKGKKKLEINLYNGIPVRFKIDDKEYILKQIINNNVKRYKRLKNELKVKLKGFDFFKEKIFATYDVESNNEVSFLKTIYKLEDKKNGVFSVTIKANLNILDPFQKYKASAQNVSYLFKNEGKLYEWQKILYLQKDPILKWVFEDGEIELVYLNDDGKEINTNILSSKLPYDIGGVWYLVSFMNKYRIEYKNISYLTNTRFEGEIQKIGDKKYEFKAFSGNVLVEDMVFNLDKYSRIIKVYDKKRKITITLKGDFLSDRILKNRKVLKDFLKEYDLKVINEK